ncbi:MAG: NUDIX domain-containing protein [Candidatus Levybacteria bacterium]|nr:NUDIX domain-containing protein [Candidatus Levybacteria bacterium]
MSDTRFTFRAAVFVIFERDGLVLLQRRFNTGWEDGKYSLVSGHIEEGERVVAAAVREAKEEAGVTVKEEDFQIVHVMHNKTDSQYINFFLKTNKWKGDVINMEPDRCDDLKWFSKGSIPDNTIYFIKEFFENIKDSNDIFSEFGF